MSTLVHEPATAPTVDAERGASSWRALGTYVDLRTTPEAVDAATELAAAVLHEVDLACSRFRDDSDLMVANRAAGPAPSRSRRCSSVRCAWPSRPPPRPTAWSTRCSATC